MTEKCMGSKTLGPATLLEFVAFQRSVFGVPAAWLHDVLQFAKARRSKCMPAASRPGRANNQGFKAMSLAAIVRPRLDAGDVCTTGRDRRALRDARKSACRPLQLLTMSRQFLLFCYLTYLMWLSIFSARQAFA
jgi:hypothetical protein